MKISEPIEYIKSVLSKGPSSDDLRYSDRLIYHLLLILRANVIRQRANVNHYIAPDTYQTIAPSLEPVDKSEVPTLYTTGVTLLRSTQPIPEILNSRHGLLVENFRTLAGEEIPYTNASQVRYARYSKHRKDTPQIYIRGNYLYVVGSKSLAGIVADAVIYDPIDAVEMTDTCIDLSTCESAYDLDFHLDPDLMDDIYKLSYNDLINVMYQMPIDFENDAKDVEITKKA